MPIEQDDTNPFGDELGDALRRTAGTFRPDARALVAGGHLRGRRLRRRRTAMVTAAVAAVAVAGAGGVMAAGLGTKGASGRGGSGVAAAPEHPAGPTTTAAPAKQQPAAHPKALSAHQVETIFLRLLPRDGKVSEFVGRGTAQGVPYAHAVYDDGHGKAAVEAGVGAQGQTPGCPSPNPDPQTSCTLTHVNGGTLMIYKGFEYPDHRVETKNWYAEFQTASGAVVDFSEWNSSQEKGAPITRPEPPLTSAQITALLTSPLWQKVIDALPDPSQQRHSASPVAVASRPATGAPAVRP